MCDHSRVDVKRTVVVIRARLDDVGCARAGSRLGARFYAHLRFLPDPNSRADLCFQARHRFQADAGPIGQADGRKRWADLLSMKSV